MDQVAQEALANVLDVVPDAMVVVDADGRIVVVNALAARLFGYEPDALFGQSIDVLVPDSARAAHAAHRARYLVDPQPRPMGVGLELSAVRSDGSEFPAEISLSAFAGVDGLLVTAAIRDMTERLASHEERERLREQLDRTRRLGSLGQLAGGVAHDFNNLLGVILNYAAFVRETLDTLHAEGEDHRRLEEARQDLQQIQSAAERAAVLTRRLLSVGRPETARAQTLDLNAIVGDVQRLLIGAIGDHITLETRLGQELLPIVADRGQLEQILINLALNARDAMPAGGRLTIDTANVDLDAASAAGEPALMPGPHVRLRVSDTGTGMAAAVVERAFEPFFTTKPQGEGTGLGLATVQSIVTLAGGRVDLASDPGHGTTVSILLPAVPVAATGAEAGRRPPRSAGGETVLVVEEDAALREVARRILVRGGYRVLVARSGEDAVAIASAHGGPIDLLMTDVVLADMSGRDVTRRLRELRPDTRVLYMSGHPHPPPDPHGAADEPMQVVPKPFGEAMLLHSIREALAAPAHDAAISPPQP